MTIAVDFDGTIVTHAYPAIGKELPGAIATLNRLQQEGHRLILWTVREGELLDQAVDFCRARGLEFFSVNANYTGESSDAATACRKVTADIYIDDRNIGGFPGWEAIYAMVHNRMSFQHYLNNLSETKVRRRNFLQRLFSTPGK